MATLLHSESRRLYSWWWDSHISPKNSKWLQENLTDMDAKVKAMIKLIEEDADSFARRAEMYYKKRPELMKLVEEFYRAYRALAERYDHATVELRQAHKTMAEAFPNQEHYLLTDDSPCGSSGTGAEPHTPEIPHPIRALLDLNRKGLKQLSEIFGLSQLSAQNNGEKLNEQIERAELEVKSLRKNLAELNEEKETVAALYKQCLQKISTMESELLHAQEVSQRLHREIEFGAEKLKTAEKHCDMLERSNRSLQLEADVLLQKISMKDQKLLEKHTELERLQTMMHEEQSRFLQIESTLHTLQMSYSQSQEEQRSLALELKHGLQLLEDLELSKQEELHALLLAQKEKHANHKRSSEARMANLENLVIRLQDEHQLGKMEFEEQLDKAVNAQVEMFILQKCVEDLEQKNMGLLVECQKHVEASKFTDQVISELESENLMQQMELEFLLDEIRKFKMGIHQVLGSLQVDLDGRHAKGVKQEELPIPQILNTIEGMKGSLVKAQEEKLQLLVENSVLLTVLSQQESEGGILLSEKRILEQDVILHEAVTLKTLTMVYESFLTEKVLEQQALAEHLSNLHTVNSGLKQELGLLRKKFDVKESENVYLKESVERMDKDLQEAKTETDHLNCQIESSEHLLEKKNEELLEMEERLKAAEMLSAEFCRNIEKLKMEQQQLGLINENLERQIIELSEGCINHQKEIEHLNKANRSLLSEMSSLRHEVEQQRVREETLSSELLGKTNEFELWEAEAATFYFDLQISSINEALLENKVNELTGVCMRLEDESDAKSLEIKQMTERVGLLESELGGLKGQLSAYTPVISSLKEDFASLEHTALLRMNKKTVVCNQEEKDAVMETCLQENGYQSLTDNKSTLIPDGVSDLLSMKARIRAVEKSMVEEIERHVKAENLTTKANPGALTKVPNVVFSPCIENGNRKEENVFKDNVNSCRTKSENGSLMKDIPLDHISDTPASKSCRRENMKQSSVPTEDVISYHQSDNSGKFQNTSSELDVEKELGVDRLLLSKSIKERTQDGKRRKILERLASDSQKLTVLKTTVQELKMKMETKKRSKKGDDTEYETVKRQIEEVEGAVVKLVDTNDQLTKDLDESMSSLSRETSIELEKSRHNQRKRVTEQARKGSEQIGRLQFEVQNIQYTLLKLVDEKSKGKSRFSGKTVVLLRDFIQSGKKSSKKRKGFCGCSRPSTKED
uniref:NAB domain-containing protein n=1 Tax=Cajanus cajan TaxID=3821 RepID=A0A151U6U1_CAJCA|nr:hypothetical protein KK1_007694 [Cajanus cajan]